MAVALQIVFTGVGWSADALPQPAGMVESGLSKEQLRSLADSLEDEQQRNLLIGQLRALAAAQPKEENKQDVRTATTELLRQTSEGMAETTRSFSEALDAAQQLPAEIETRVRSLQEPTVRRQWMRGVADLLLALLPAALLAWLLRLLLSRWTDKSRPEERPPVTVRLWKLSGFLAVDLLPPVCFAMVAYGLLTFTAPGPTTRILILALINAGIVTRVLIALINFSLSPAREDLRLWRIDGRTAASLGRRLGRMTKVAAYGFFLLEALLYLGIDLRLYQGGRRLLGLAVLLMLLALVTRYRRLVAAAIADEAAAGKRPSGRLAKMRMTLARIWHIVVGGFLLVVYGVWFFEVHNGFVYVLKATLLTLLLMGVSRLLTKSLHRLAQRVLELSGGLHREYPELEKRVVRYLPLVRGTGLLAINFGFLVGALWAWGAPVRAIFTDGPVRVLLDMAVNVLLTLGVALMVWEVACSFIERYLAERDDVPLSRTPSARTRTLLTVSRNALLVLLCTITALTVLSELGINIAPLLAGAGIIGLAVGFGSQRLVQDVINGVFILFQDLMSVGDVVTLGSTSGVVEALTIRTVRLRDLAGTVHTIPFSSIDTVSNLTRDFSFHVFNVGVAYRENVDEVLALLEAIDGELRTDSEVGPSILEPIEIFGVDALGDSSVVIKGRFRTVPGKQWAVGRAFNRLVKLRFDAAGIEIPFPHQTLYFGQDKQGAAPPAYVQLSTLRNGDDALVGQTRDEAPARAPQAEQEPKD